LKKLRREVVNEIHPDRASCDADRLLRERLTKEANAAYLREDDIYAAPPPKLPTITFDSFTMLST
jgi:hypothetical protein